MTTNKVRRITKEHESRYQQWQRDSRSAGGAKWRNGIIG